MTDLHNDRFEMYLVLLAMCIAAWMTWRVAEAVTHHEPLRMEIRKVEPRKKAAPNVIKTDWQVCDIRVVWQIQGARVYEVTMRCGTSGEHK